VTSRTSFVLNSYW